ncbi:hypothetical protein FACS1894111_10890 [Clostridia bacterium]|nr:hypothetical protein FACS1894111_10890 [Clostridia bacterium]
MKHIEDLILYNKNEHGYLLSEVPAFLGREEPKDLRRQEGGNLAYPQAVSQTYREKLSSCVGALIQAADSYGFEGNLWQSYLTFYLVNHENAYSIACERRGEVRGSLADLASHDFAIFRELFHLDLSEVFHGIQKGILNSIKHYRPSDFDRGGVSNRIRKEIANLSRALAAAEDDAEFQSLIAAFYQSFGVGKLGLHKAFRVNEKKSQDIKEAIFHRKSREFSGETSPWTETIEPITKIASVDLSDLVGYEIAKKKLLDNTLAFLKGLPANNCLLYGDAGTGKSSSIKAILNQYYDDGLRMIEVYKHQFKELNTIISTIKNRNYRFIIYMDDLSFEDFEIDYKYLKAVIEGGLEKKPENVLIYATSNRRHLIREKFSDKAELLDDDLHKNDTVQEKLSLAARFGIPIYFGAPELKEYETIVKVLAQRNGITLPENELLAKARQWEISHGGRSGRTAEQFIQYISTQ